MPVIRTVIVGVVLALHTLVLGPVLILHALLTGSVDLLYRVGLAGVLFAMRAAGVRVRVEGLENIPPGVCVFVANHTSNADPPAVVGAIPRRVALLAKREIFRVPIVASALRLASFVPVDRANREAALASVEKTIEHLRKGVSFLIYPEGTRSPDGRLRPFKKGSFVMTIRAGVPLVPVAVIGAHRVQRKGELAIHPGEILVKFLPAVETSSYTAEQRDALIARVHAAIAGALPSDQQPLRGREVGEGGS